MLPLLSRRIGLLGRGGLGRRRLGRQGWRCILSRPLERFSNGCEMHTHFLGFLFLELVLSALGLSGRPGLWLCIRLVWMRCSG